MTSYMTGRPSNPPPNPPSPKRRTWRTVAQVAIATLVAVPSAVALLPISAAVAVWVVGISGAAVILASAAVNAVDERTGRG